MRTSASRGVHAYLEEKPVPGVWFVEGNSLDATHWRAHLWLFVTAAPRQVQI
jgi:hypothetical protein